MYSCICCTAECLRDTRHPSRDVVSAHGDVCKSSSFRWRRVPSCRPGVAAEWLRDVGGSRGPSHEQRQRASGRCHTTVTRRSDDAITDSLQESQMPAELARAGLPRTSTTPAVTDARRRCPRMGLAAPAAAACPTRAGAFGHRGGVVALALVVAVLSGLGHVATAGICPKGMFRAVCWKAPSAAFTDMVCL